MYRNRRQRSSTLERRNWFSWATRASRQTTGCMILKRVTVTVSRHVIFNERAAGAGTTGPTSEIKLTLPLSEDVDESAEDNEPNDIGAAVGNAGADNAAAGDARAGQAAEDDDAAARVTAENAGEAGNVRNVCRSNVRLRNSAHTSEVFAASRKVQLPIDVPGGSLWSGSCSVDRGDRGRARFTSEEWDVGDRTASPRRGNNRLQVGLQGVKRLRGKNVPLQGTSVRARVHVAAGYGLHGGVLTGSEVPLSPCIARHHHPGRPQNRAVPCANCISPRDTGRRHPHGGSHRSQGQRRSGPRGVVCKLKRPLYALKQTPRCWNVKFTGFLKRFNLRQTDADKCMFFSVYDGHEVYLALFVDDSIVTTKSSKVIKNIIDSLNEEFEITLGDCSNFVGIQICHDRATKTMHLYQTAYTRKIIERFGMSSAKGVSVPADPQRYCTVLYTVESHDDKHNVLLRSRPDRG